MLISTKPNSKGKEAAIFRSRQLTDFKWTPQRDITTYTKATGKTKLCAGIEQTGMIYSSTEPVDKFITENVSFETMLSVIANPDSALYTKDLDGHNNSWPYFGVVCNGLVRYSLDIRYRYSTKRWRTIPGMRKIADEADYTVEQIELCDILHAFGNGRNHVAFITDILRDDNGIIRQIEVSEAVRPTCKRKQYDVETFYEKYKLFALWRYDFVDSVSMPAETIVGVPKLGSIAIDYGNKTNYRTCEDVVISAFGDGENAIEIYSGDEVIEKLSIQGKGNISRKFDRGYYTVKHVNTGESVEFCVTMPQIYHRVENGFISVQVDSCDCGSKISHMEFREGTRADRKDDENNQTLFYNPICASLAKMEELTDEEKKTGLITREIPADAKNFKIYFENKYGIWTHAMIRI